MINTNTVLTTRTDKKREALVKKTNDKYEHGLIKLVLQEREGLSKTTNYYYEHCLIKLVLQEREALSKTSNNVYTVNFNHKYCAFAQHTCSSYIN